MTKHFKKKIYALVIAVLLLWQFPCSRSFAEEGSAYRVSPNDLLDINVFEEPLLTVTARVSSSGSVSYPLLGEIKVAGLTVKEVEDLIEEKLKEDYLINPQVGVVLKERAKANIIGEIRLPGFYEIKDNFTLFDLISAAGGLGEYANPKGVTITRVKGEAKSVFKVSLGAYEAEEDFKAAREVYIEADDVVSVPRLGRISIVGQVRSPGSYSLKKGMRVLEAIALAGGFSAAAAPNGTTVVRIQNSEKQVFKVPFNSVISGGSADKNILLEENDTIVVPESFF